TAAPRRPAAKSSLRAEPVSMGFLLLADALADVAQFIEECPGGIAALAVEAQREPELFERPPDSVFQRGIATLRVQVRAGMVQRGNGQGKLRGLVPAGGVEPLGLFRGHRPEQAVDRRSIIRRPLYFTEPTFELLRDLLRHVGNSVRVRSGGMGPAHQPLE